MSDDLMPQPAWKQKRDRLVSWWRKSKDRRQAALKTLRNAGAKALTLAISVAGGMLISYGVWRVYPPAGFVVGGLLCWLALWSHEQDEKRRRG